MKHDDALAPVIAVMLILAIGVTVFAVYTSTYLPGLKQQAEVEHLKDVESGFLRFSSDIDNAIASGKPNITYSEQIPLGGGDILVNSMKSSGTIRIQNETLGNITVTGSINNGTPWSSPIQLNSVNYLFAPSGNFWVDQGYIWKRGYVTVTKGSRSTPLQFDSTNDPKLNDPIRALAGSLVSEQDEKSLTILRIVSGTNNVASSNGVVRLGLTTTDVTREIMDPDFNNPVRNASIVYNPENASDLFQSDLGDSINNTDALLGPDNTVSVKIIEITVGVN